MTELTSPEEYDHIRQKDLFSFNLWTRSHDDDISPMTCVDTLSLCKLRPSSEQEWHCKPAGNASSPILMVGG